MAVGKSGNQSKYFVCARVLGRLNVGASADRVALTVQYCSSRHRSSSLYAFHDTAGLLQQDDVQGFVQGGG